MGWKARLILIAVGVASVPTAEFAMDRSRQQEDLVEVSRRARLRLLQEIRLRSALADATVGESGWTTEVSPAWFASPPAPPWWIEAERDWLEVAGAEHALLLDPPDRTLGESNDAVWWYNPTLGVLRARVPLQRDRVSTHELYARVNH